MIMSVINKAVEWALEIANDPAHGYDQNSRWGPDYDCSSFVISAFKAAGLPLKATYTGDMKYDFLRNGFVVVTDKTLKRGDVLLHERNHTALYIGNGQVVHASINEKGTIKGGAVGDQTGGEITVRGYYDYPWDVVLRYTGEESVDPVKTVSAQLPVIQKGDKGPAVAMLQAALRYHGYDPTWIDGDFGTRTHNMLTAFQKKRGLGVDGICGPMTWAELHKG